MTVFKVELKLTEGPGLDGSNWNCRPTPAVAVERQWLCARDLQASIREWLPRGSCRNDGDHHHVGMKSFDTQTTKPAAAMPAKTAPTNDQTIPAA